ncbi:MAG TPA: cytochrome c-type biogenesis protein CcmH [Gemmatimonadales bacterium]
MNRRRFLGLGAAALVFPRQTPSDADPLRDPSAAGRSRLPVGDLDNSEMVKEVERRLKCTCPCNLDVFTCRTTDFSCEYSPAMHREVMDLVRDGKTSEQVITAFIEKYGERVLMAPRPVGFNLAGYLVPGVLVSVAATALAVVLLRRHRIVEAAATGSGTAAGPSPAERPSPEEMDRLKQALSEVAD